MQFVGTKLYKSELILNRNRFSLKLEFRLELKYTVLIIRLECLNSNTPKNLTGIYEFVPL